MSDFSCFLIEQAFWMVLCNVFISFLTPPTLSFEHNNLTLINQLVCDVQRGTKYMGLRCHISLAHQDEHQNGRSINNIKDTKKVDMENMIR